jgi:hypothetical protein
VAGEEVATVVVAAEEPASQPESREPTDTASATHRATGTIGIFRGIDRPPSRDPSPGRTVPDPCPCVQRLVFEEAGE